MNKPSKSFFVIQEYFKILTAEISNVTLNTQKLVYKPVLD